MHSEEQKTPVLFIGLTIISIMLAAVPTVWSGLDLAIASRFQSALATSAPNAWWWVEWINVNIPQAFRILLGIVFLIWVAAMLRPRWKTLRLPLAFIVLGGIFGPGLVVNAAFKDNWQRARPYQVQNFGGQQAFTRAGVITDQCNNNCSFVSGHVACGFFFSTLMLVHRRRRIFWALTGTSAGLVIGFARMANMDHWLSDVLWAYPITLVSSWVVWKALQWASAFKKSSRPRIASDE